MNERITNNLYEFWTYIGVVINKLTVADTYSAVSLDDSDWPNRVFNLKNSNNAIENVIRLGQEGKLPKIVTDGKSDIGTNSPNFQLFFEQKNMALDLKTTPSNISKNSNVVQVLKEEDAIRFAKTASEAFGYRVDPNVVCKIIANPEKLRLFIYQEGNECLGCGIVFFDSNSNAGLHMIGTIPKGRGKGIGKKMTEYLLLEAKEAQMDFCVLHASLMGESIYRKLGFKQYGKICTYKISENGNN